MLLSLATTVIKSLGDIGLTKPSTNPSFSAKSGSLAINCLIAERAA